MFNISCESKQQQISYVYSNTIFYNVNSTFNTPITGTYNCCLLAVTSCRECEAVCKNITTTGNTSEFVFVVPAILIHINNLFDLISGQIRSFISETNVFTTNVIKTTATTVTVITTVTFVTISPSSTINTIKTFSPTESITTVTISPSSTINTIKTLSPTESITTVTISPSCTSNTIKTHCPTGSSDTITNSIPWVGGVLVGVVSGVLVMVMVWVIVAIVRKERKKKVDNTITYNKR